MKLKFKLNIDKDAEEITEATVNAKSDFTEELEYLVMKYNRTDSITGYTDNDVKKLKFYDIEYITVIDSKTYAFDKECNQYRLKQRLYETEVLLPKSFIRINKSTFANTIHIEKYTLAFSGGIDVVFKSGSKEYVSRRCFAQIKKEMKSK